MNHKLAYKIKIRQKTRQKDKAIKEKLDISIKEKLDISIKNSKE